MIVRIQSIHFAAAILAGVSVVTLRELSAQHKARSEAKAAEKEQHTGK